VLVHTYNPSLWRLRQPGLCNDTLFEKVKTQIDAEINMRTQLLLFQPVIRDFQKCKIIFFH
jgi:hypothetical protein